MDFIPRLLAFASASLLLLGFETVEQGQQPATGTTTTVVAGGTSFSPATTTTTTTIATPTTTANDAMVPPTARCGQWWGLALDLGWHADSMPTLDYVMWRESRCDPTQHNTTLNPDGSTDIGLTQINDRSWCLPTRWYPDGYLQTVGVLTTVGCNDLFDPATNLKAAKAIHEYHTEQGQNGFGAWEL